MRLVGGSVKTQVMLRERDGREKWQQRCLGDRTGVLLHAIAKIAQGQRVSAQLRRHGRYRCTAKRNSASESIKINRPIVGWSGLAEWD